MNHQYKVVFNRSLGLWQAVSELAKARGKSKSSSVRRSAWVGLAALIGAPLWSGSAGAQAVCVADVCTIAGSWDSTNYTDNTYVQSDGSTTTYNGNFTLPAAGTVSVQTNYWDMQTLGYGTGLPADYPDKPGITVGSLSRGISVPNETNPSLGNETFQVYNNNNFVITNSSTLNNVASGANIYNSAADANIFFDLRLATVQSGTLNVNVTSARLGNNTATLNVAPGRLGAKNTVLFMAEDTGSVVLTRDMSVRFESSTAITANVNILDGTVTNNVPVTTFAGTFSTVINGVTTSHTVNNLDDLKQYNTFLIAELQAGRLATSAYETEFNRAYKTDLVPFTFDRTGPNTILPSDPLFSPMIRNVLAAADGPAATASIAPGVNIWFLAYDQQFLPTTTGAITPMAALYATNGGPSPTMGCCRVILQRMAIAKASPFWWIAAARVSTMASSPLTEPRWSRTLPSPRAMMRLSAKARG
jgi:hypothetical protein